MSKLTDEDIRLAIAKGGDAVQKSELMPPWGNTLTAPEMEVSLSAEAEARMARATTLRAFHVPTSAEPVIS